MTEQNYLWDKRHAVLYRTELSTLYHQKRERFFSACDKLGSAQGHDGRVVHLSLMQRVFAHLFDFSVQAHSNAA